jgi:anti-sigma factor RsiW
MTTPRFPDPPGLTVTDELLSAWLDGELNTPEQQPQRAAVEAWLREHPEDAARVRLWAADAEGLRARLAPVLDAAVPDSLRAVVMRRPWAVPRWAMAASAVGLLLGGGVLGGAAAWRWLPPRAEPVAAVTLPAAWVQRAAYAHSVYVPEPRHAVEVKAQEEHLARWLTRRIDVPVKLFDLHRQGFELVGGRLLPDGAGKGAQLMYQDAQGLRVTVYLRKPEVGTPAAFRYERQGELGLFYWVESGAGYALVGALPRAQLLALAQAIYEQGGGQAGAGAEK